MPTTVNFRTFHSNLSDRGENAHLFEAKDIEMVRLLWPRALIWPTRLSEG